MKFRATRIANALSNIKQNTVKFSPQKSGKYNVYFPEGVDSQEARIHEWKKDGKFGSTACIGKENDCPFCKVENEGWDYYNAHLEEELAKIDQTDADAVSKVKRSLVPRITHKDYLYTLVGIVTPAKADGTPESYELKVMRLSESRLSAFRDFAKETTESGELEGATLLLKFGDDDNARDIAKNMTILPGKPISDQIKRDIDEEAANYNWEANLGTFFEFKDMSPEAIAQVVNDTDATTDEDTTATDNDENPFVDGDAQVETKEETPAKEETPKATTPAPAKEETPTAPKKPDDGGNGGNGGNGGGDSSLFDIL